MIRSLTLLLTLLLAGPALGAEPIFEKSFGSMSTAGPFIAAMYLMNGLPE
jgi:hypothetical protein